MKKLVIGGAICAVLLVAAVWVGLDYFLVEKVNPSAPPSAEKYPLSFLEGDPASVTPDVVEFLEALAEDVRAGEATKAAGRFDTTRLYVIAATHDLSPDPKLSKLIGGQLPHLYPAVLGAIGPDGFGLPWDRLEILNATEVTGLHVVNVRHISGDHVVPVRWWLAKSPKGIAAVDAEDLRTGLRISHSFATLLMPDDGTGRKLNVGHAVRAIREASAKLTQDKPRDVDVALVPAKGTPISPALSKAALALDGLAAAALGQTDKADPIEAALGELPAAKLIRMMSRNGDNQLGQRLGAAHSYEASFGPTPQTMNVRIHMLLLEGKKEEAANAVEAGLKRYPDSPTLLMWAAILFS